MKKNFRIELRLSEDDYRLFQQKSKSYGGNMSAIIRDAVSKFDDKFFRRKIWTIVMMYDYFKIYQNDLSKLGGNFKPMHRANELAIAGKLTQDYLVNTIMPKMQEALSLIRTLKQDLDNIHALLLK